MKKHYKPYSFRLNDDTVKNLAEEKGDDLSWNKFFIELLNLRRDRTCSDCGSIKNIQVHHKENGEKILLCLQCHKKTDNWGKHKTN